ncbi:MAG TPA: hypothetical protein VN048_11080 [Verrucomicrobiae bacterium]|jgi:hypothetical protein|nr:hypothetical protein [Verrucomicrobiae bacterium]
MTTNIALVQRGIVFLMAEWSGQAKWAYKQLKDFWELHNGTPEHLICVDIDREQNVVCALPELAGKIHGYGEAAVVRDGKIVFVTTLGKDKSQIQNRCEELLKFYRA